MKQIQQLRCIALKLGVSGTALPISETRLYKGSYGFVKLQVYVPKTQNTEAPVCTAFCTTTDELGREKISSHNYNLIYVEECELDGMSYLLFESMLPKEFTQTVTSPNGLKITFNYYDTAVTVDAQGNAILDDNGVPKRHTTDLLVSSTYTTTVYPGGWNNEDIQLGVNSAEAGQIAENMRNIAEIQDQMDDIKEIADGTHADSSEALSTAREAKATADGLADSIAQANTTAGQAVDTANGAVEDIAKYKGDTDSDIAQFKQTVNDEITQFESATDGKIESFENTVSNDLANYKAKTDEQIADMDSKASEALSTANQAKETADELTVSIAQANTTAGQAKSIAEEALEQSKITGTKVDVNGEFQTDLNFDSDPQTQLDELKSADTTLEETLDVSWKFRDATAIPANADLNDYKVAGNYAVKSYDNMLTVKNKPSSLASIFVIKVFSSIGANDDAYPLQLVISFGKQLYIRQFNNENNEWSDWTEYATVANTVKKSGDILSGRLLIDQRNGGTPYFCVQVADNKWLQLQITPDGKLRGLYDGETNSWLIYFDENGKAHYADNEFGQRLRGYKDLANGATLNGEESGFYSNAYDIYSKSIKVGPANGDGFSLTWDFGGTYQYGLWLRVYNSGKLQYEQRIADGVSTPLLIDTSKLEPTTANGWTIISHVNNDAFAAGVYLVAPKINDKWMSAEIMVVSPQGNNAFGACVVSPSSAGGSVYLIDVASVSAGSAYLTLWSYYTFDNTGKHNPQQIAYKKLA